MYVYKYTGSESIPCWIEIDKMLEKKYIGSTTKKDQENSKTYRCHVISKLMSFMPYEFGPFIRNYNTEYLVRSVNGEAKLTESLCPN